MTLKNKEVSAYLNTD